MRHSPAVRRRRLGDELRRLRDRAGLTSPQAARLVGWHQSKVSRIETGRSAVKPSDVTRLLDVYGVKDPRLRELVDALTGLSAKEGGKHWWHAYRGLLPPQYRDLISLESQAGSARTLETTVVPGLLQTPDYARAVTRAALAGLPGAKVDSLVEVRIARQEVLRGARPLDLRAVLDEAALRRPVGGRQVMKEQLRQLLEVGELPHVRLQVLPFESGAHIGLTGPFVIFSFPNMADLDMVVIDHLTSSLYLERKEDLKAYEAAFNALQAQALSPEESSALIARIGDAR
ncbi:transcriptional regulator [Streptomyces agglomeratus]|uniref:helix-turn-helix domain-containing protein n=1 Tax=Streptomyces agglomeratus TaxID=285458 RepID=UPI000853F4ED|nr:helix-turn-helix transcriptional regulator [Streptomyces agglomeratus]OEJ50401.1 transcriptional regulator [Streptomyces agglomeratus]OEJ57730.1 transcriptional regulator [Streptomyces agglomeratus]